MSVQIQRESTEYLYVGVFGNVPAIDQEMAFKAAGDRPESADWEGAVLVDNDQHALWVDASSAVDGDFYVAVLVGPMGGVELSTGPYQVWLRLTDNIERPVRIVPEVLEIQ